MATRDYQTVIYEEREGVAWITLDRPERHNAFNSLMQREMRDIWRSMRFNEDVRCAVLTGAGDQAFCSGIDRMEQMGGETDEHTDDTVVGAHGGTPFHLNDPGSNLGPKSCDLWKPVIAAVNGLACGGAFYMLGEVEFIIAAEHATFFDPHVTYGMTASFEPIHMSGITPFGDIARISLMGSHERMTAQRAYDIGMVSQVVPGAELLDAAGFCAGVIAAQPKLAVEGTVRALWAAREFGSRAAVSLGYAFVGLGTSQDSLAEGQRQFESGERPEWRAR